MRLVVSQRAQPKYDLQTIAAILRDIETQVNQLSEGKRVAVTNATSAVPSGATQPYAVGDFVKNSAPSEVTQTNAVSYVVAGWMNTGAGLPGTFEECRWLTSDITFNSANFTGTNWTDLTDGGTTTLHTHTTGIATSITVANEATDTTCFPVFVTAATGNLDPKSNATLTFNSSTGQLGVASLTTPGQVTSTLATGTAPLVIASTTKVANLNVDLLDDQSGAFYLDSANFTGTNWTDLTDAGDTTLHQHSAVTVANEATDTTCFVNFTTAATGNLQPKTNTNMTFNSSTGVVTFASSVLTTTDINGGTVDGAAIGGASASTGAFTTISASGQVTSTVVTGTAPLVIASTTKVNNLHVARSTLADTVTVADTTDSSCNVALFESATGDMAAKTDGALTYNATTGSLSSTLYAVGANQVLTARQTGWGTPSSTLARTTFATYAGQTITDNYGNLGTLFAQVQTIDDHLKIVSQRLGALITDLITHGMIGA